MFIKVLFDDFQLVRSCESHKKIPPFIAPTGSPTNGGELHMIEHLTRRAENENPIVVPLSRFRKRGFWVKLLANPPFALN
jgi:hypothetical protein